MLLSVPLLAEPFPGWLLRGGTAKAHTPPLLLVVLFQQLSPWSGHGREQTVALHSLFPSLLTSAKSSVTVSSDVPSVELFELSLSDTLSLAP